MAQFKQGDETDQNLCRTLTHEFLRCDDAFTEFIAAAHELSAGSESREVSYRAYNAYARFILHLYEFLIGCAQRDRLDTAEIKGAEAEVLIAASAQRAFRLHTASFNSAPLGAASLNSGVTESMDRLKDFAKAVRLARNTAMGHVKHQRPDLSLSDFYHKQHKYLVALHRSSIHMWGSIGGELPDLGEITAFSVVVKSQPPEPVS